MTALCLLQMAYIFIFITFTFTSQAVNTSPYLKLLSMSTGDRLVESQTLQMINWKKSNVKGQSASTKHVKYSSNFKIMMNDRAEKV